MDSHTDTGASQRQPRTPPRCSGGPHCQPGTWWETRRHLHATVRHGHGVIGQRVTGDLTVVGAGGRCEDVAGAHVVRVHGVAPPKGPVGKGPQLCIPTLPKTASPACLRPACCPGPGPSGQRAGGLSAPTVAQGGSESSAPGGEARG